MFHFTVVFFITVISDIAVHHASLIVRSTCLSATVFHWLPVFNHNLVKINPVYSNAEPHWWLICLLVSLSLTIQGSLRKYLVVLPAVLSLTWIKIVLNQTIHSSLCPANINARAHTHARTHARTRTLRRMVQPPQAACLRLDVRCWRQLHSSQLLWIHYLLCSSKHWFTFLRKSNRTDIHSPVPWKIGTFGEKKNKIKNGAVCKTNTRIQNSCKSFSRVVIQT